MDRKAVIFDFGRVIGNFDHMITCNKLARISDHTSEDIYELIFQSGLEKEYDEGLPFDQFYEKVIQVIKPHTKISQADFEDIWGNIFSENAEIEHVLKKIPAHINMFILSNTNKVHWKWIERLPTVSRFFGNTEQQILSFRVGKRKPAPEIYQEGIVRTGVPVDKIVYVDDVSEFVETFVTMGGHGIVYNSENDPLKKLESGLREFRILG